jgi:hypothetical protein
MRHIDYDMSKSLKGVSSWGMWSKIGPAIVAPRATYKWGLDDPQDIKQLEPKLELIKEYRPSELVGFSRFPLWWRAPYRIQEVNPTLRRMERTIVYRFENSSSESRS